VRFPRATRQMAVLIAGRRFWLWRAVDDEGEVLDLLVQRRRDKTAAVKLMTKRRRERIMLDNAEELRAIRAAPRARTPPKPENFGDSL
jgi:transposase-like protein